VIIDLVTMETNKMTMETR